MNLSLSSETAETQTTTRRKVPRLVSLLHRLQRAKDAQGQPLPYLDELMIFLDDPPSGTLDRWKQGAEMCRGWGFETTGSSVYRLYNSYLAMWRMEMAEEAMPDAADLPAYRDRAARLTALRTVEALAHSRLAPAHLIGLARLEVRRQSLELARKKFELAQHTKMEMALDALADEISKNPEAHAAFDNLRVLLTKKEEDPDPQPKKTLPPSPDSPKPPLHPPDPPHPSDPPDTVRQSSPLFVPDNSFMEHPHAPIPLGGIIYRRAQVAPGNALVRESQLPPPAKPANSTEKQAEQPSGADSGRSQVQLGNEGKHF